MLMKFNHENICISIDKSIYNRGEEREYRTWIFKMPSKSRAPGIDHPTDSARVYGIWMPLVM